MTSTENCACHHFGRWSLIAIILVVALGILGWATMEQRKSILRTANDLGQCGTFIDCVQKAGLSGVLEKDGPFSVFIPTDEAFGKLSKEQLKKLLDNKSALTALLLYHMVPKKLSGSEMENLQNLMTCTVPQSSIAVTEHQYGKANCVKSSIPCTNGVIFLVDAVQIPPFLSDQQPVVEEESVTVEETVTVPNNSAPATKPATEKAKEAPKTETKPAEDKKQNEPAKQEDQKPAAPTA